ncbi:hypothetical protein [Thermomonas aquatica]|uniref:Uncharacterized protein n=1 Tax=Thermomonas aquatica TaxID=2202149 RepID=A0A5B7ZS36_9GAMM|nr:hypothetical protein [Thermomonas aquatica]QDA57637.1 hypothetical protein FHQ07_10125 [Thermomonas aquatica]
MGHTNEDAPARRKVAVREVAVTTGIPGCAGMLSRWQKSIRPGKFRKTAAGLFRGAGYGNNTGLIAGLSGPGVRHG